MRIESGKELGGLGIRNSNIYYNSIIIIILPLSLSYPFPSDSPYFYYYSRWGGGNERNENDKINDNILCGFHGETDKLSFPPRMEIKRNKKHEYTELTRRK